MLVHEHLETAREFLAKSDREFADGDLMQGSEKLWGAAAQVVMAIAQERGWPFHDHRNLKAAVNRLSEEYDDPSLRAEFGVAEKFHANYYHKFMQDYEYDDDRATVRQFVERALTLAG